MYFGSLPFWVILWQYAYVLRILFFIYCKNWDRSACVQCASKMTCKFILPVHNRAGELLLSGFMKASQALLRASWKAAAMFYSAIRRGFEPFSCWHQAYIEKFIETVKSILLHACMWETYMCHLKLMLCVTSRHTTKLTHYRHLSCSIQDMEHYFVFYAFRTNTALMSAHSHGLWMTPIKSTDQDAGHTA